MSDETDDARWIAMSRALRRKDAALAESMLVQLERLAGVAEELATLGQAVIDAPSSAEIRPPTTAARAAPPVARATPSRH